MAIPITQNTSAFNTFGSKESFEYRLSNSPVAVAYFMNMLRNQVYTNKPMAVIREYWCNARDSVVMAGKDPSKHVFITLPSRFDYNLRIRDEGLGLTHQQVKDIFAAYGESEKRETNLAIGQLGIGSKSAFAYTDSYQIVAIKDGVKNSYYSCASSDLNSKEGRGKFDLVDTCETDKPNGVEIVVPVRQWDVDVFKRNFLFLMQFVTENERPIVVNDNIEYENRTYTYSGDKWGLTGNGVSYAIMGGVPYKIDHSALEDTEESYKSLLGLGVDLYFDVGELEHTISREELQYTSLVTDKLNEKLKIIVDYLANEFSDIYDNCTSLWDAKYVWYQYMQGNGVKRDILNRVLGGASNTAWNGIAIQTNKLIVPDGVMIWEAYKNCKDEIDIICGSLQVQHEKFPKVVIRDAAPYGEKQRMATVMQSLSSEGEEVKHFYLIGFAKDGAKKEFLEKNGLDDSFFYRKLSQFDRAKKKYCRSTKTYAKTFGFDYAGHASRQSDHWKEEEVDVKQDKGVYIHIHRFLGDYNGRELNGHNIQEFLERLGEINQRPDILYGFKPAIAEKAKKSGNWESLEEYMTRVFNEYFDKNQEGMKAFAEYNAFHSSNVVLANNSYSHDCLDNLKTLFKATDNKLLGETVNALKSIRDKNKKACDNSERYLYVWAKNNILHFKYTANPIKVDTVDDAQKELLDKYPLLQLISIRYGMDDIQKEILVNFFKKES